MTTIEIGDKSEENIDFSAAGSSGAGTSGVRKHARDPVDDVRCSNEEEDDEVVAELVGKWSSVERGRGRRACVRGGRQQGGRQIRARRGKAQILSRRHHDMVGRMRGRVAHQGV